MHVPRLVADRLATTVATRPVAVVVGPRQAGKTTLVRAALPGASYVTLDSLAHRASAKADPEGFLRRHPAPLVVDEVQRVPELMIAIKLIVDEQRQPGRFCVTGSADVLSLTAVSESLAGRAGFVRLLPLSERELAGGTGSFVDDLLAAVERPLGGGPLDRGDLLERATRGGFPEVAVRAIADEDRVSWFDDYLSALLQRDVRDLADIARLADIPAILRELAAGAPGTVRTSALAGRTGVPHTTLTRYLALLGQLFLTIRLPPWSPRAGGRDARSARVLFADTGLLAHVLGVTAGSFEARSGALLENLVATEVLKHASWSRERPTVGHWRTARGSHEVDLVVEARDGRVAAIEVKASSRVAEGDFRGLRALRDLCGERFVRGVVLYGGSEPLPFGDRLVAWPVTTLWAPPTARPTAIGGNLRG